jgi:hypothetical protein
MLCQRTLEERTVGFINDYPCKLAPAQHKHILERPRPVLRALLVSVRRTVLVQLKNDPTTTAMCVKCCAGRRADQPNT